MRQLSAEHFLRMLEINERRWAEHERKIENHAAEHQANIAKIRALKRQTAPRDPTLDELDAVLPAIRLRKNRFAHANT